MVMVGESEKDRWVEKVGDRLREMIREWEDLMDVDDERLYSLGLRHALDVVEGREIRKDVFVTTEDERRAADA